MNLKIALGKALDSQKTVAVNLQKDGSIAKVDGQINEGEAERYC